MIFTVYPAQCIIGASDGLGPKMYKVSESMRKCKVRSDNSISLRDCKAVILKYSYYNILIFLIESNMVANSS